MKMLQLDQVFKNCDWCGSRDKRVLYIPYDLWLWWHDRTTVRPRLELLALIQATEAVGNVEGWMVTKMWLPKQRVTSVECEILESSGEANGMIHSHHGMSAKMSSQDEKELLPAYGISIVTNHDREVEAYERVTLPCGGIGFRKLEVLVGKSEAAEDEVEEAIVPDSESAKGVVITQTWERSTKVNAADDADEARELASLEDLIVDAENANIDVIDLEAFREWQAAQGRLPGY